jgi:hypothetical protein
MNEMNAKIVAGEINNILLYLFCGKGNLRNKSDAFDRDMKWMC